MWQHAFAFVQGAACMPSCATAVGRSVPAVVGPEEIQSSFKNLSLRHKLGDQPHCAACPHAGANARTQFRLHV